MGIVYKAHDTLLDRDVAVKVLWTSALGSQGRARLLREAQAAARLNHPNIINIYDAGDTNGLSYIVMELLDGESLYDHKPGSMEEILRIVGQITDALEHAHAHGIIHRDLKPENVIVTSQGIAKLTDFGLSRSITARISQEGIIVGTVYYLAPEQALRQDIDLRADLYALGVLTYELVTGRLPFIADDPIGVISQHLNAPVIPPSTYNNLIPPALEALILRLMSKNPDDRPTTAADVRAALERIYEEPQEYDSSILAGLSPLDRLARGRLVGRQGEFNQIKNLWRSIISDRGPENPENVVVISGEAGIGKTPLVKEVRSLAQVSGARTLLGECYSRENAPYAPIVEILRAAQPFPEGMPDLIMADLHTLAPDLETRPVPAKVSLSPLSEQQRIFESLFALLATMAERQPMLVILENAQWADANTLLFMRHLARRARSAHLRLMVMITSRPGEVEEKSTFKNVLVDLSQEHLSIKIEMRPFDREKTRALLSSMFMQEITDDFLDAIYKVTEGNLFFIEQICKALIEDGSLYVENGQWNFCGAGEMLLPQSVRMALQVRINRLPESAQDVLRMASIIGREFDYEVLRRACDRHSEDELIEAVEAAIRAQLINEVDGSPRSRHLAGPGAISERFVFAHALIPATLREGISSLRRRRIHRQIAEAFEIVHPDDLETLAYHFAQAGDTEKALAYTARAGDRARMLYANEEALRFYGDALGMTSEADKNRFHILSSRASVYDVLAQRAEQRADIDEMLHLADLQQDDTMLCDALIALADLLLGTENLLALEPALRAVELSRKLNDPVREGRALRGVGWGAYIKQDYHESLSALETAVARFRQAGMLIQAAQCLHILSLVTGMQGLGEMEVSAKYAEDAVQLSRIAGDPRQEAISLRRVAIVKMDKQEYDEALQILQHSLNLHRELGDRLEECLALNAMAVTLTSMGKEPEACSLFSDAFQMALNLGSSLGIWMIFANMQWFCYRFEGRFEDAVQFASETLARPEIQKDPFLVSNILKLKAELLYDLGQYPAAIEILRDARIVADQYAGPVLQASIRLIIARLHADLGQFSEAQSALEEARQLSRKFERANDVAAINILEAEIDRREWEAGNLKQIRRAGMLIEQAVSLLRSTQWEFDLAIALTTAAWVALSQDHPEQALSYIEEAGSLFDKFPMRPEGFQYTYACALWANGRDEEAAAFLELAYQRVMQIASLTESESIRKSWLEDVYINRQIVNDWVNFHDL